MPWEGPEELELELDMKYIVNVMMKAKTSTDKVSQRKPARRGPMH